MKLFSWLAFTLAAISPSALAHSIEIEVNFHQPVVLLEATFAGGAAVSGATVEIYRPGGITDQFLASPMDRHGRFAFAPDAPGHWSALIDDGLGHRERITIALPEDFLTASSQARESPTTNSANQLSRLFLGLGAILALSGGIAWWRARVAIRTPETLS